MRLHVPFTSRDRTIRIAVHEALLAAAVSVAVAALIAATTDLGQHADISYYGTVAQVIPVFLLALMVESTARLNRSFDFTKGVMEDRQGTQDALMEWEQELRESGASSEELDSAREQLSTIAVETEALWREFRGFLPRVQRVVRGYVIVAVPGEAACLWALAAGEGNTFVLSLAAASLVAMVLLYARSLGSHYTLD